MDGIISIFLILIVIFLAAFGVASITKPDIIISEEVCLDAGLVVYKYNKCTTEEWASEQINKLIKVK